MKNKRSFHKEDRNNSNKSEDFRSRLNNLKNNLEEFIDRKNDQNIGFCVKNSEDEMKNEPALYENLLENNKKNFENLLFLHKEFAKIYNINTRIFHQIIKESKMNYIEFYNILKECLIKNRHLEFYKSKKIDNIQI